MSVPLTTTQLIEKLTRMVSLKPELADMPASIAVANPSIGGRQFIEVTDVAAGFDWENGRLILTTSDAHLLRLTHPFEMAKVTAVKSGDRADATKLTLVHAGGLGRQSLKTDLLPGDRIFLAKS